MSEFTKEEIEEIKLSNHIASRKIGEFQTYILLLEKTLGIHKTGLYVKQNEKLKTF